MWRREFIVLLGASALPWILACGGTVKPQDRQGRRALARRQRGRRA